VKKPLALLALLVAPLFVASACSSVAPYAAVVGGHRIAQSALDAELNAIKANKDYVKQIEAGGAKVAGTGTSTFDLSFTDQVLTRQIFYALADQELAKRKVTVGTSDLAKARTAVLSQLGQGDAAAGQTLLNGFPVSYRDTLVRREAQINLLSTALDASYYDAHKADLIQVCASHILAGVKDKTDPSGQKIDLVASKAKADQVAARLAKGDDFATIAKEMSDDTGSGAQGGDLGCATPDSYVKEFAAATKSQPLGVVGQPVQTQFGFHFIKVKSRDPMTLDQFEQQVTAGSIQISPLNDFLRTAIAKTKLSVNPKFGTFDKNAQQPGVVPPTTPTTKAPAGGVPATAPPTTG
jgi:foldase protein PrsA